MGNCEKPVKIAHMLTGLTLTESDHRARQVAPDAHLSLIEIRSQGLPPVARWQVCGTCGWSRLFVAKKAF